MSSTRHYGAIRILSCLGTTALIFSNVGSAAPDDGFRVGGSGLYALKAGQGAPAVVFVSGMGEDLNTWKDVQPNTAQLTTTFLYDRAGLGRSEPSPGARDARTLAIELRAVLRQAAVSPPFVVVGHSLGAWIAAVFAHDYPRETAGLVLIDPAYRESRLRSALLPADWAEREQALARYATAMSDAQRREKEALDSSGEQVFGAFPLPRVPAVLLTGTKINPSFPSSGVERDVKLQDHKEWMAKAGAIEHVIVPDARHYIQNEAPQQVIAAITGVVMTARKVSRK
jgi:pimeloyl-ACP methyl ester carboxylesterase